MTLLVGVVVLFLILLVFSIAVETRRMTERKQNDPLFSPIFAAIFVHSVSRRFLGDEGFSVVAIGLAFVVGAAIYGGMKFVAAK